MKSDARSRAADGAALPDDVTIDADPAVENAPLFGGRDDGDDARPHVGLQHHHQSDEHGERDAVP